MMEFRFASKSYGDRKVLQATHFELDEGEVTALLGPSGIGKTTLLRMIAGLEPDDSGATCRTPGIGMVFQEPRLLPWLTVLENVELVGPESGWLDQMGIGDARHLYPRQLSLGMARRVAIVRALAVNPELLVLDEPFASLDAATAHSVKEGLVHLFRQRRITTLLVTHHSEETSLAAKRLVLSGKPAKLETGQFVRR